MVKTTKNRWFLTQDVLFRGKNDENFMQIQYLKWLIYRENVKKVIGFNNWKKVVKTLKKVHFHPFSYNFPICMWMKNEIMSIFYMQKTAKKIAWKTCQKWKIEQFSKSSKIIKSASNHVLNSGKNSYRLFWPESKVWKKFIMPMFGRMNFWRHVCVF